MLFKKGLVAFIMSVFASSCASGAYGSARGGTYTHVHEEHLRVNGGSNTNLSFPPGPYHGLDATPHDGEIYTSSDGTRLVYHENRGQGWLCLVNNPRQCISVHSGPPPGS